MPTTLVVKRLTGGTLYKMLLIGVVAIHIVSSIIVAALIVLGVLPFEAAASDQSALTLLGIVLAYLVVGLLFSPLLAGMLWISIWPGLWIYALYRPMQLTYIKAANDHAM